MADPRARARALFNAIDTNSDGTIDESELRAYCRMLRLPESSAECVLAFVGGASVLTLPMLSTALSRQVHPTDIMSYMPPGEAALPTSESLARSFQALSARATPPGCLHVDDLRAALLSALPALDRARSASAAAAGALSARGATPGNLKGGRQRAAQQALPPPPAEQAPPLKERINEILSVVGVSPSGHVRYAELISLLMRG